MIEEVEPEYSVTRAGEVITIAAAVVVDGKPHAHHVKVHASSKPTHDADKTFGEMSDQELVDAEVHSFDEWAQSWGGGQ